MLVLLSPEPHRQKYANYGFRIGRTMAATVFSSSAILRKSLILNWLPRMDSNYDKVIQSHLCCRYTTRQS